VTVDVEWHSSEGATSEDGDISLNPAGSPHEVSGTILLPSSC